jgi:hypothetical protein
MWKSLKTNKFNKKNRKLSKSHKKGGKPPNRDGLALVCTFCLESAVDIAQDENIIMTLSHTGVPVCSMCIENHVRTQVADAYHNTLEWLQRAPNHIRLDPVNDLVGYDSKYLCNIISNEACNLLKTAIRTIIPPTELLDYTGIEIPAGIVQGVNNNYCCPRCLWGPIANDGCADLYNHHGDPTPTGGLRDNSCYICGFISNYRRDFYPQIPGIESFNSCRIPDQIRTAVNIFDTNFPNWKNRVRSYFSNEKPYLLSMVDAQLTPAYLQAKLDRGLRDLAERIVEDNAHPIYRNFIADKKKKHCQNAKQSLLSFMSNPQNFSDAYNWSIGGNIPAFITALRASMV